jgi:hypothetical protein
MVASGQLSLETLWQMLGMYGELPEDFSPEKEMERLAQAAEEEAARLGELRDEEMLEEPGATEEQEPARNQGNKKPSPRSVKKDQPAKTSVESDNRTYVNGRQKRRGERKR